MPRARVQFRATQILLVAAAVVFARPDSAGAQDCAIPTICAAPATPTPNRAALDAQRRNQDAQAFYNFEQARLLEEKLNTPAVLRFLSDSAAALGATIAAVVALYQLFAGRRQERQTQLYEALKRFGDKDSVTARATGATMLRSITRLGPLQNLLMKLRFGSATSQFYIVTDQLMSGLAVETDLNVLAAIGKALMSLARLNPAVVREMEFMPPPPDLVDNIAVKLLQPPDDPRRTREEVVADMLGWDSARLDAFLTVNRSRVQASQQRFQRLDEARQAAAEEAAYEALKIQALREGMLRNIQGSATPHVNRGSI